MKTYVTYAATSTAITVGYNAAQQTVIPKFAPDTDNGLVTVSVNGTSVGASPSTLTLKNGDTVSASGGACVFRVVIDWDYTQDKPLSIYHWVDLADSLGDVTLHGASSTSSGIKGDYKYSKVIEDRTGIQVSYLSKGGCGFYKGGGTAYGTGDTVASRAQQVPYDADIVTLWGSYNDQIVYSFIASNTECEETDAWYGQPTYGRIPICLDNDGNPVWKYAVSNKYWYGGKALTAEVLKSCPLNETLTGIDNTPIKKTLVAYINEAVHVIRKRAPFAKICYVSGGWCRNNGEDNAMWRNLQYLLWEMSCRANQEWLNLLWCTYPGKGYPEGYVDTIAEYRVGTNTAGDSVDYKSAVLNQGNPYLNFIDGWGLSYGQANSDHSIAADPAASDLFTVAYSWWASPGHPNDDFHEQFHAPVVCEYLCRQLGVDTSYIPARLRATHQEITYKDGFTEYQRLAGMTAQVTGVSLNKNTVALTVGNSATLTATVSPSSASEQRVLFVSSNDTVATVDSAGVVTAHNVGEATITAITVDGGKQASATITVAAQTSSTIRKHWKTYAASTTGVTITNEAGTVNQTLTVSNNTLAYIGDSVTVSVNGTLVGVNPQTLTVKGGDVVTASSGTCVFRVQITHEFAADGSDVFYGLNWVCVGDSLLSIQQNGADGFNNYSQAVKAWEMLSGQYATGRAEYDATAPTNSMKRPALMSGINCYSGLNTAGAYLAQGGTGMYRSSPYYLRLEDCPHDADIVTLYGSINDWNYRVAGGSGDISYGSTSNGKFFTESNMVKFTDTLQYGQNVMENDGADADELNTYARYVSKAIEVAHKQAPLAKIVILSPIFYNVQKAAIDSRLYSDPPNVRYIVYRDYLRKYGENNWLSWTTWGLQSSATYDSTNNRWNLTTVSGSWLNDDSILVDGETIPSYKMMSDTSFAGKYVYDYSESAASYGHMNTLYNEIYLAPKFANLICDTLGLSGYYLPQTLKCNNLTYTPPGIDPAIYSITTNAVGCTISGASTITEGASTSLTVRALTGYTLPTTVTVTGAVYTWNAATGILYLSNPTGPVIVTIVAVKPATVYPIMINATGCTVKGAASLVESASTTLSVTANSGYILPSTVSVTGATYGWNSATGILILSNPTGNITITIVATKIVSSTYTITYHLTNCTSTDAPTSIKVGQAVAMAITVNSGYILPTAIKVANASYTWDPNKGQLVLYDATGNVDITIIAVAQPTTTTNIPIYTKDLQQIIARSEVWFLNGTEHPSRMYTKKLDEIYFNDQSYSTFVTTSGNFIIKDGKIFYVLDSNSSND
mgnify:CR=1 FL=1